MLRQAIVRFFTYLRNNGDNVKKWVEIIGIVGGLIVTVIGGYIGLKSYKVSLEQQQTNIDQAKIQASFSFFNRFNSSPIAEHNTKISKAWVEAKSNHQAIEAAKTEESWKAYMYTVINDYDLESPIENMISFYKEVQICVESTHCNKDTAIEFFGDEADNLFSAHYPYIEDIRHMQQVSFAAHLEEFVSTYRNSKPIQ